MSGYRLVLGARQGPAQQRGPGRKRAVDSTVSGSCVDCMHSLLIDDPYVIGDEKLVCTRYVSEVDGSYLLCGVLRDWSGACGKHGAGFEPREGSA